MNHINFDDVRAQLLGAGLILDKDLTFDARIQRWKTDSGKGNERNGWSRLREWTSKAGNIYIVGAYGIWQGTDDGYTKIELPKRDDPARPELTPADIAAIKEAQKEAARKLAETRKAEAKQAAQWAALVWSHCAPATEHDYTTRKQIKPHGLRVLQATEGIELPGIDDSNFWRLKQAIGALVVPMHDANGNVCGIQFIYPADHPRREKTDKEFWPAGMAMGGTFGLIGPVQRLGVVLVAEGYATAASLHEATGQTVAYAFSANNLLKAGKLLRKAYPRLRLLFCADDDAATEAKLGHNPGVDAAVAATAALEHAAWCKPDFLDEHGADRRGGKKLSDYNDLAVLSGLPLVLATQINAKLDELKWKDAPASRGGTANRGEGSPNVDSDGRRRALSVMPLDDIVQRFIPLDDGTGKYVFDTWTNKIALREQMITLLPAGVRGDDIKRHPAYIERGAYYLDQVGFDPSGNDHGVKLNTWRGWPMEARPGKCERILELLRYLCNQHDNGDDVFRWVLQWMAYPLQHPGAKMSSAIIMHGPQGTGKSTVFQCLAKIYGDYSTVLNQRGIEDKFNSDWADSKLFILAEEVVTRAEMWHIKNELKELVTGEWIRVNPKNIAAYRQRNHLNIVYLSNENQPLPLESDDRRHLVVYTPPELGEEYYDEVFLEIEAGGVEAFYHYLLNLDTASFHPKKRPPMTEAKKALIALSSPSELRFVHEWTSGDLGLPVCPALSTDVYVAYLRWCKSRGESRPRPDNQFHGAVARMAGWEKKKARVCAGLNMHASSTEPRTVTVPPVSVIDADRRLPSLAYPDGTSQIIWITGGILDFQAAMKDEIALKRAFG